MDGGADVPLGSAPGFENQKCKQQRDDPDAEDCLDFAEEMRGLGLETHVLHRVLVARRGGVLLTQLFAMLIPPAMGDVHNFRREERVDNREAEDDRCNEVERFGCRAMTELLSERKLRVL